MKIFTISTCHRCPFNDAFYKSEYNYCHYYKKEIPLLRENGFIIKESNCNVSSIIVNDGLNDIQIMGYLDY